MWCTLLWRSTVASPFHFSRFYELLLHEVEAVVILNLRTRHGRGEEDCTQSLHSTTHGTNSTLLDRSTWVSIDRSIWSSRACMCGKKNKNEITVLGFLAFVSWERLDKNDQKKKKEMAVGMEEAQEIVKARTDKRDYRRIVLPNSLQVLLISDPDTDKVLSLSIHLYGVFGSCFHFLFLLVLITSMSRCFSFVSDF